MDAATLRTLLSYEPATGQFTCLAKRNGIKSQTAGYVGRDGYVSIRLNGVLYKAHRLAWLYMHGEFPIGPIDHINGTTSDNRAANLRLASHAQNMHNSRISKNNKSGYKGVCWSRSVGKWRAQIGIDGKRLCLGYYADPKLAYERYCEAAKTYHKEFAKLG